MLLKVYKLIVNTPKATTFEGRFNRSMKIVNELLNFLFLLRFAKLNKLWFNFSDSEITCCPTKFGKRMTRRIASKTIESLIKNKTFSICKKPVEVWICSKARSVPLRDKKHKNK
jgi:hypothetical protein